MDAAIRCLRGVLLLAALAALALLLRWATAGTLDQLSAGDFGSLAGLFAAAVAWTAYGWLCLAVAVTVLQRLPGTAGRTAAIVSAGITSDGSRTLLRSALGVAAAAPLTVGVAHATPTGGDAHPVHWAPVEKASSVPARTSLRVQQAQQQPGARAAGWDPRGGTERPSTVRIGDSASTQPRLAIPDRPTTGAATRYTPIHPGKTKHSKPAPPASVVVQRGDSLWSIAAAELGPDASDAAIAARWPQWYAANAQRIGPDPDLIYPGQVLKAPAQHPNQEK